MNKKAQEGVIIVGVIVVLGILLIGGFFYLVSLFLNSGSSTDYPYNVEKNAAGWTKLWLKDDHTTVYCFDDERFLPIIEQAKAENKKVTVYYQEYIFRGFFCSSGNENIGTVVVTDIQIQ